MLNYGLIILGGGIGAAMRYWMSGAVQRWTGSIFPLGVFVVNVLGCFVIGFLMTSLEERFLVTPALRIFLGIGVLGGFTTFSSFSYETVSMLQDAEYFYAMLNIGLSVIICLAATYIGKMVGKIF